jgi:HSP20 family protein
MDNALEKNDQPNGTTPMERQSVCYTPRVDILENEEGLTIYADMPGVKPDDVEVLFDKGELSLHGRCSASVEGRNFLAAEYGIGDFYRAFSISQDIDADRISAELKQGVLTVRLPKSEAVKPRKIQVQGS